MFKVGKTVIAIKDHSQLYFLKDQKFVITEINKTPCCGALLIGIGIPQRHQNSHYNSNCKISYPNPSKIQETLFIAASFRLLDDSFAEGVEEYISQLVKEDSLILI